MSTSGYHVHAHTVAHACTRIVEIGSCLLVELAAPVVSEIRCSAESSSTEGSVMEAWLQEQLVLFAVVVTMACCTDAGK